MVERNGKEQKVSKKLRDGAKGSIGVKCGIGFIFELSWSQSHVIPKCVTQRLEGPQRRLLPRSNQKQKSNYDVGGYASMRFIKRQYLHMDPPRAKPVVPTELLTISGALDYRPHYDRMEISS